MHLINLGQEESIEEGKPIVKDCHDQRIMVTKQQGEVRCFAVPDAFNPDTSRELPSSKHGLQVYKDKDGTVWTTLRKSPKPIKGDLKAAAYGMETPVEPTAEHLPPLVPFAGCDKKPMSPSPAKPFSMQASPLKPSPFKERVDTATEAVMRKNWSQRQARMGALFGGAKEAAAAAAAEAPAAPPVPPAAAPSAAAAVITAPVMPVAPPTAAAVRAGGMRIPGPEEMDE